MLLRIIPFFSFLFFANVLFAQYTVKGQVNINENWQPKIYMAAVNKLSDYYRTSPDMIIKSAEIDANGKFEIKGDNLPDEKRFYRLYVMKKQNSDFDACLYVGGDDLNFVHILLENGENVEINANLTKTAPFEEYQIIGQKENHLMQSLSNIVYPRFYFHRIEFPTELKFSEDKLHTDLKKFADTCSSTLVALAAINNTDFDEYYDQNPALYQDFKTRLKSDLPKSIYTKNYDLKVKYYANEETLLPNWAKLLLAFLSLSLMGLLIKLNQFKNRIHILENQNIVPIKIDIPKPSIDELLTQKEKEILQLISQGKSNKEIANTLFVELSTVKTHINKIYSKIGASNRKEAQSLAKRAFQSGV
ncbi:MAG: response regulator transcription factor [Saprospiraceae bacterium]